MTSSHKIKIAIVGDVHDDWDLEEDSKALHFLQPDLVLFTGDYGDENVELVRSIAKVDIRKSVILGNHDCWRTHQFSEKKVDRVQLQLECLGKAHVGYSRMDFSDLKISVVGGRPFSCGGPGLYRSKLLSARYGVGNMNESVKKICEEALGTPKNHFIVLLAHNGPTGLGSNKDDICGKDWVREAGDHGDPDLAKALVEIKSNTKHTVPLVVFGHMHKALTFGGERNMIVIGDDNTIYLNAAIVPRVVKHESKKESTLRAFTLVEIIDKAVKKITETWVLVDESRILIQKESVLFERSI